MKIDWSTSTDLEKIAAYEHKKKSTMVRDWLVEKVRVYERNPAYKRFLRQMQEATQTAYKQRDEFAARRKGKGHDDEE